MGLLFIIFITFMALFFDYTNGMHDAVNSNSTIVSTRVVSPRQAVIRAAFFNFIAFLLFDRTVAETIGKGMIDIKTVIPTVIFAGLGGYFMEYDCVIFRTAKQFSSCTTSADTLAQPS